MGFYIFAEMLVMNKIASILLGLAAFTASAQSLSPDTAQVEPHPGGSPPNKDNSTLTLSQSADPNTIDTGGVACWNNVTFEYRDNAFARTYDLANDFGITQDFQITAVEWGQGSGDTGKDIQIMIHIVDTENLPTANFELVNLVTHTISSSDNMSLVTTPITAEIPAGSIVAVEVFGPDEGTVPEQRLFPGFNLSGQNNTAWIKSDGTGTGGVYQGCEIYWTDSNTISADPQEYVINLVGFETTLGVTDYLSELIKIYPNPTNDRLRLEIPAHLTMTEAGLYDVRGGLLDVPISGRELDLDGLPIGVYILQIETPYGTATKRIIKE